MHCLSEEQLSRISRLVREVEKLSDIEKLYLYLQLPCGRAELAEGPKCKLNNNSNKCGDIFAKKPDQETTQTYTWILSHLEEDPSVSLPKQEVYDEYRSFCQANRFEPLCVADFGKAMKHAFPFIKPRRLGQRGNSRYCYSGLRKRYKIESPSVPSITTCRIGDDNFQHHLQEAPLTCCSNTPNALNGIPTSNHFVKQEHKVIHEHQSFNNNNNNNSNSNHSSYDDSPNRSAAHSRRPYEAMNLKLEPINHEAHLMQQTNTVNSDTFIHQDNNSNNHLQEHHHHNHNNQHQPHHHQHQHQHQHRNQHEEHNDTYSNGSCTNEVGNENENGLHQPLISSLPQTGINQVGHLHHQQNHHHHHQHQHQNHHQSFHQLTVPQRHHTLEDNCELLQEQQQQHQHQVLSSTQPLLTSMQHYNNQDYQLAQRSGTPDDDDYRHNYQDLTRPIVSGTFPFTGQSGLMRKVCMSTGAPASGIPFKYDSAPQSGCCADQNGRSNGMESFECGGGSGGDVAELNGNGDGSVDINGGDSNGASGGELDCHIDSNQQNNQMHTNGQHMIRQKPASQHHIPPHLRSTPTQLHFNSADVDLCASPFQSPAGTPYPMIGSCGSAGSSTSGGGGGGGGGGIGSTGDLPYLTPPTTSTAQQQVYYSNSINTVTAINGDCMQYPPAE